MKCIHSSGLKADGNWMERDGSKGSLRCWEGTLSSNRMEHNFHIRWWILKLFNWRLCCSLFCCNEEWWLEMGVVQRYQGWGYQTIDMGDPTLWFLWVIELFTPLTYPSTTLLYQSTRTLKSVTINPWFTFNKHTKNKGRPTVKTINWSSITLRPYLLHN